MGKVSLISCMNDALAAAARRVADVHVVDYAALVNRHGALNWYDERMRLYARAPIAGAMQGHLADEYVKFIRALAGGAKKCLVLDLDNTLWGGIVGEDGVDAIRLGATYPGSAFVQFQRLVQDLARRGVILALASKNNPADVDEVFARHPSMVLRKDDFAAMEIGWNPKSESLRRIAARLAIGLEHMVFVDDNPVECEEVRRALPQVHVIALPAQPERYVRALQREGLFDTAAISDEDRRRGELYRQRAEAESARASAGSLEGFYRDLAMEISVAPIARPSLPRAAQLTQKTNQFNVTTRRYTETEIGERLRDPSWVGFTVAVKDRFGDNGIVGVALARVEGRTLAIDTLLMSCRIIGRTVETAMLAHLCDEAISRGLTSTQGPFRSYGQECTGPRSLRTPRIRARGRTRRRRRLASGSRDAPCRVASVVRAHERRSGGMTADIEARVRQVFAEILEIDAAAVGDATSMDTVEQWDSANHISLVLALEEEFGISFDVSEIEAMISFPDVVAGVLAKL